MVDPAMGGLSQCPRAGWRIWRVDRGRPTLIKPCRHARCTCWRCRSDIGRHADYRRRRGCRFRGAVQIAGCATTSGLCRRSRQTGHRTYSWSHSRARRRQHRRWKIQAERRITRPFFFPRSGWIDENRGLLRQRQCGCACGRCHERGWARGRALCRFVVGMERRSISPRGDGSRARIRPSVVAFAPDVR